MKSPTIKTLIISVFLFTIPTSLASPPTVDNVFKQCLIDFKPSNPNSPIQNFTYTPQNPKFLTILNNYVRNLRYFNNTTRKPITIVAAADVTHIQATITCSKKLGLQLRIRSGGHDYDGLSYLSTVDFVVLDMFNLRSIEFDPKVETAWVQSGATLGEIYYGVANKSNDHRGFPAGICPGLGAGGHFSGGGYGNMMRKYGLSIDNIIDAKIVDAKGRVLDRSSMGEDLFWALRGGGAASFCVVLAWKIKLVPVPEKVTVFNVETVGNRGGVNTTELVVKWQEIADKIDHSLFIRLTLSTSNKTVKASFMGMFLGDSSRLLGIMNKEFPELGLNKTECIEMKWIESVLFWLSIPPGTAPTSVMLNRIPQKQIYLKRKSDYVQKPISRTGLDAIFKVLLENENVTMAWNPYGGRMSEIPSTETAFPHRAGNMFKIQYAANWFVPGEEVANECLSQTERVFEAMGPYVSKNPREAFLNYRDVDIGTSLNSTYEEGKVYGMKYFKNNFERLVSVKGRVDPDNFFRYEQSIPVPSSH
ncbi:FAD-binding Berberine family protein [Raphanus sativus]|uniref:Berberine bridge enzyme-like 9 n=1 Tax=Raphanus sativus TaxID=3726 RepID=A0A6J0NYM3_RAPSA|nr:berberine bridge enzyme-like 9 [Raphanus sativus]KAJ4916923.1 FAD-binding Berberine family protein [Raphanus sativus]